MIFEVAKREILIRSRTKSFRIITAILLVAAIAMPVAIKVWPSSDGAEKITIGLDGGESLGGVDLPAALSAMGGERFEFEFVDLPTESLDVDEALLEDTVDVALEAGPTIVWKDQPNLELGFLIEFALQQQAAVDRGAELGLDPAEVGTIITPQPVATRFVDELSERDDNASLLALAALATAFIIPQVFGQLALMSVVEEKASGVVEVLLSHIRPRTLLSGKIVGIGVLAICQLVIVLGGMVASLLLTNSASLPESVWSFIPIFAVSLLGGMAIYITLFALLGSLVSRQEDAAQVQAPVFIPLMAGYIVGQTAAFGPADSLAAKVLTYFPLTTPMLLPVRVARDAISWWEIVLSLGLLALGVFVMIRLAAKLYEFSLLHKGTRIGWGEAISLLRS